MAITVKTAPELTPGSSPSTRVDPNVKVVNHNANQLQQLGNAAQTAGIEFGEIELKAMQKASDLRVMDSMNKLRQRTLDLQYSEDEGYAKLKGLDALERPDGLSMEDEYNSKFNQAASDIEDGLTNEYQREQFAKMANPLRNQFNASTAAHVHSEYNSYHNSVQDGALALSEQEATANWNQPHVVDNAINGIKGPDGKRVGGIKQAIYNKAKLNGQSAMEATALMKGAESAVHTKIIDLALDADNTAYAMSYFKSNRKKMTADDLLKIRGKIDTEMDNVFINTAVNKAQATNAKSFAKNHIDRLRNITLGEGAKEEDVADFDKTLRSSGGDLSQALVEYVKGDEYVEKAKKRAKDKTGSDKNWLQFTSKSARAYVEETLEKYNSGQGNTKMPTKYEFVQQAVETLGDNPRLDLVTKVKKHAEAKYEAILADMEQRADRSLERAQQELLANGGDMTKLKSSTRSELIRYDMDKLNEATKFAESVRSGVVTDLAVYSNAVSKPGDLAKMTDAEFLQMVNTKISKEDQKKVIQLRADATSGAGDSPESINTSAFNSELDSFLLEVGVDAKKPKAATIKTFLVDRLYDAQKQEGRKFSPREIHDFIVDEFARSNLQDTFGMDPELQIDMDVGDIPNKEYNDLKRALQLRGVQNPSDATILRTYWQRMRNKEK